MPAKDEEANEGPQEEKELSEGAPVGGRDGFVSEVVGGDGNGVHAGGVVVCIR